MARSLLAVVLLAAIGGGLIGGGPLLADENRVLEEHRFFETHVRPLFVEKCGQCHSGENQKGGLRLESRDLLLSGGESGPVLVPGAPEESLLVEAIRYESYEMPPDGRLRDDEIALIVKWVEMGAPWPASPADASATPATGRGELFSEADRSFWSLQPLVETVPPTAGFETERAPHGAAAARNEVDGFILAKLAEQGIAPSKEADRLTLLRRVTFDLIGLPPTVEEIEGFLADDSPGAYERLVDRLLASPRFGEHWARFWLDLVRYAESDGYRKDDYREDSWRYRDYVIAAFNDDLPFHRFVQEQVAGDEIAPGDPRALIATGFLRHGIYEYNQRNARDQWQVILNDLTDTVGDVFLGLGMGCARCHDHKFDPILQKDYYRLQAFFANVSLRDDLIAATPEEIAAHQRQLEAWEAETAELRERIDAIERPYYEAMFRDAFKKFPKDVQEQLSRPAREYTSYDRQLLDLIDRQARELHASLPKRLAKKPELIEEWKALHEALSIYDPLKPPPLARARGVVDFHAAPAEIYIPRKERLGEVLPGFLSILDPAPATLVSLTDDPDASERRSTLAGWLSRDDNPLVTRVIVNRIWKEHFGTGIVSTLSDFGHLGQRPSHPELLDWLAANFVRHGWSLKWLHKQIVMSATYRQSSFRRDAAAERIDPENRLLWRGSVRRLTAEQFRDAALAVTGELVLHSGGPGAVPEKSWRRSIYNRVIRNKPDPLLVAFDFPDRMASLAERNTTTTPGQSLLLINGEWLLQRAAALAQRISREAPGGSDSQVRELHRLLFGREATPEELERIGEYVDLNATADPLLDVCHVLLNSSEFLYTD